MTDNLDSDIWTNVAATLRGAPPSGRLGQIAVGVYLLCSIASIAWGLSGGSNPDNALGAAVRWLQTESSSPSLMVTNQSGENWTNLRIVVDKRYFVEREEVREGRTTAVSLDEFSDGYYLPRPDGMYPYEWVYPRSDIAGIVPTSPEYRPAQVQIETDQGNYWTDRLLP